MNTELSFDEKGYLIPYDEIETNLETLKKYFVDAFPNSRTRSLIFNNYEKFIADFQYEIFPHFEHWIGGSFVSMKENPRDIDISVFIDYRISEMRNKKLEKFWSFSLEDKFIDSYIVKEYPKEHLNYQSFAESKINRYDLYSSDRNEVSKGFLKLVFTR